VWANITKPILPWGFGVIHRWGKQIMPNNSGIKRINLRTDYTIQALKLYPILLVHYAIDRENNEQAVLNGSLYNRALRMQATNYAFH
jgi:hypothetical protein